MFIINCTCIERNFTRYSLLCCFPSFFFSPYFTFCRSKILGFTSFSVLSRHARRKYFSNILGSSVRHTTHEIICCCFFDHYFILPRTASEIVLEYQSDLTSPYFPDLFQSPSEQTSDIGIVYSSLHTSSIEKVIELFFSAMIFHYTIVNHIKCFHQLFQRQQIDTLSLKLRADPFSVYFFHSIPSPITSIYRFSIEDGKIWQIGSSFYNFFSSSDG